MLPAHDLFRNLQKPNDSSPLSIGYRLSSAVVKSNEIALGNKMITLYIRDEYATNIIIDSTILENDARKPTKAHNFSDIVTPMG